MICPRLLTDGRPLPARARGASAESTARPRSRPRSWGQILTVMTGAARGRPPPPAQRTQVVCVGVQGPQGLGVMRGTAWIPWRQKGSLAPALERRRGHSRTISLVFTPCPPHHVPHATSPTPRPPRRIPHTVSPTRVPHTMSLTPCPPPAMPVTPRPSTGRFRLSPEIRRTGSGWALVGSVGPQHRPLRRWPVPGARPSMTNVLEVKTCCLFPNSHLRPSPRPAGHLSDR